MLSRRQFLAGAGTTGIAVATGLDEIVLGTNSAAAPIKKRRITLEEAATRPELSAKYIMELLIDMFGEDQIRTYIKDVRYFRTRESYFQQYPPTTETDKEIARQSDILTAYDSSRFGSAVRSDIVVFPDIFRTQRVKISGKEIPVYVTEDILKAFLEHEFEHAKDNYSGIMLRNGSEINSNNFNRINPEIFLFVREARGYVKELTAIMKTEKVEPITLLQGKIDETKRGYAWTIFGFVTRVVQRAYNKIDPKLLTPEEYRLMTGQLDEIRAKYPELLAIDQVKPLYRKFSK